MSEKPVRIAVDIGGTFTDLQILDARSGRIAAHKVPTTPEDPSIGLMDGIGQAARRFGFALADVAHVLHGTTIATNAVLERKFPPGVLVTTAGFEDVLEIGRHNRRDIYSVRPQPAPVLIPRDRRIGIVERTTARGSVETALDERALAGLVERLGVLAPATVAVALINAYVNPAHEQAIAARIARDIPGLPVSLSSDVAPEIREYERSNTTVLNALLVPVVRGYLEQLRGRMADAGFAPHLLIVQSNGSVCSPEVAAREPVRLLLSGPSGGALATLNLSRELGLPALVGVDMGGTSFDVSVVRGDRIDVVTQGEIDRLPVRVPMIEIRTIGAGGGSIARVAPGARVTVGPESAGSRPGPVCYGRGGAEPTVTDANLLLGRLDPGYFLGGRMALDVERSRAALAQQIGRPLGLDADAAADGIVTITNANLAAAIRLSLFEKGLDPRDFALLSFGGAGSIHACAVADELGVRRVVFPENASTLSAWGILHSDIGHDLARSQVMPFDASAAGMLAQMAEALAGQAHDRLATDSIAERDRALTFAADLRYKGQAFELTVPWAAAGFDAAAIAATADAFHALHRQRFSYANPGDVVELVTLRLAAKGRLARGRATHAAARCATPGASAGRRRSVHVGGERRDVPVWRRDQVAAGAVLQGPVIVEEDYTTVLIAPGWSARMASGGHLVAERSQDASVVNRSSPEPAGAALDAIELEVLRNALTAAAAEMDVTMWRTSRSTIVREMLDYSTAIFDAAGNNVAQSARIPQHLNSMGFCLKAVVDGFIPLDRWRDGDVVITNDPYCGAQHLPDIVAFRPVFHGGRRVAIVGTLCHHLDVGGMSPGSYNANATEIYQEGLRIPPLKLFDAGYRNDAVWSMLGSNVRQPATVLGDLQSQIASLGVGVAGIEKLAAKYGSPTLDRACRQLLDGSEAAMREVIRRMPDGVYEFEDFLDDDGIDTERPVRIHARVTIAGDTMTVDLSGCAPQVTGPINATLGSSSSAVYFAVMACADRPIPPNAGCYRPVRIVAPEGSIVNARHPAPVAHRIAPGHVLLAVLLGALSKAVPDRVPAASYAVSYVCSFQTIAADHSRRVLVEIEVGGCGAHPAGDGASAFSFGMHNNASIPMELIEADMPITFMGYGLVANSGGIGARRGGLGLTRSWRIDSERATFTGQMDRFRHRPFGLFGGGPGAPGRLILIRDGKETALHSKVGNLPLVKGDIIRLETSGGGGHGNPAERASEADAADRRLGYVTRD